MRTRTLCASLVAAGPLLVFGCGTSDNAGGPGAYSGSGGALGTAGGSSGGGASGNPGVTCSNMGATFKSCTGACVDTATSATNCGACGNACPSITPFCSSGTCSATCSFTLCSGQCVNTMGSDALNCGACGTVCSAGQSCNAGVCGCAAGQTSCSGACVDTSSSATNCGACGMACPSGQTCSGGTCTMGGSAGSGGGSAGSGGGSAGSGGGTRPSGCPAAPGLLSDFEEGKGVLVQQEDRTGWWYTFADTDSGTQTPPPAGNGIAVAAVDASEQATCNKFALHSTATKHSMYAGFGATLKPTGSTPNAKAPVDIGRGMYTGISFKIRSGAAATPILFEFLNRETQPGPGCTTCGVDLGGTAVNANVDAFNTRGRVLSSTGATADQQIPTAPPGKVITIPFATLAPRYLPSGCTGTGMCEAPPFNPSSVLGVQFSEQMQFTPSAGYDLWVDDVTLTKADAGLPTLTQTAGAAHPFPRDGAVGTCAKPTGASGKYLVEAYQNWKKTFVVADGSNARVRRPEVNNDTVSEGIGYGLLIAVYVNDKDLFDKLWGFWKSKSAGAGPSNAPLMDWKAGSGNGSAVDADEDAAFALLQAGKQWSGGTYTKDGTDLVKAIFSAEVDAGKYLKPGNNFGGQNETNPSYFAPAYYREFAKVDAGDDWGTVITNVYKMLGSIQGSTGLVPAWCTATCSAAGSMHGYADEKYYQYDAHRTPWRIGLDACWNGNTDAQNYVKKTSAFFSGAAANGMGRLVDEYDTGGIPKLAAKFNSMSLIGTAAAGAMYSAATNAAQKQFLDRSWQFLLDASYTADPTFRDGVTGAYTYYNATVGLLTALTLSGNFNNF